MVLLDSEGISSVKTGGQEDNQVFTLCVLLASLLIYNSKGVPKRTDLNELEYPFLIRGLVSTALVGSRHECLVLSTDYKVLWPP